MGEGAKLRDNRLFAHQAVKINWRALKHVPAALPADRETALEAVKQGWRALGCASAEQ